MFGYIKTDDPELKLREYEKYRGYYCGLCSILKKKYGMTACFMLSHDCVFLYLLCSSIDDKMEYTEQKRCLFRPYRKKKLFITAEGGEYAAAMNVILAYEKNMDDYSDEKSFKSALLKILYKRAYKKAAKEYPELAESIKSHISELSAKEKAREKGIDETADPFGRLLGEVLASASEVDAINLYELGYALGRWIYIADAAEDLPGDIKKGRYNVLAERFGNDPDNDELKEAEEFNLYASANSAVTAYRRFELLKNKGILDNIIESALFKTSKKVLDGENRAERKDNGPL